MNSKLKKKKIARSTIEQSRAGPKAAEVQEAPGGGR